MKTTSPLTTSMAVLCLFVLDGCRFGYEMVLDDESVDLGLGGSGGSDGDPSGGNSSSDTGGGDSGGSTGSGGGASGGTGSGGDNTSGGSTGSGGDPSTGGANGVGGDFIVTTGVDENDAGATVEAPLGTGLSLREAIQLANTTAGHQTITFEPGVVVALTSALPTIGETVTIFGGEVSGAGTGPNARCFYIDTSDVVLDGMEIHSCKGEPIQIQSGSGNVIQNCHLHDNPKSILLYGTLPIVQSNTIVGGNSHAVAVYSDGGEIRDNLIFDAAGKAVFVSQSSHNVLIVGNLMVGCGGAIGFGSTSMGAKIWFNTMAYNDGTAVSVGQASNVEIRNNIISHSTMYGVQAACDKLASFDHNLFFANAMGDTSGCAGGANSLFVDPLYTNAAADDFTLQAGSPAIHSGLDIGEDRNGAAPGNYNGAGPDRGYLETP